MGSFFVAGPPWCRLLLLLVEYLQGRTDGVEAEADPKRHIFLGRHEVAPGEHVCDVICAHDDPYQLNINTQYSSSVLAHRILLISPGGS